METGELLKIILALIFTVLILIFVFVILGPKLGLNINIFAQYQLIGGNG
ncbi:hypothetical protein [Candidatus Nanobsidianus stetteri]|uniref:Uncharacterized protein n=1 Tax=Nanobsidianus stetteri TaxID=1294122 RepID=A0AAE3EG84_NANST|nr:hypothetical protein [Candidatus Nanobsidianus stetteri]MCC5447200.1 hypothetical protein [Candidatus Nanobsidianus stetteri]